MTTPLKHEHLLVTAYVKNPPTGSSDDAKERLSKWLEMIIDDIGMKLLSGPHVEYVDVPGNRGLTAVCIIETSHIAIHIWDEPSPALIQMDVYSCSTLDPNIVLEHLNVFDPVCVFAKFLDREKGFVELREDFEHKEEK